MEESFSKALKLSGMSSTTTLVVWSMIIFLIALILGIAILFKIQLEKRNIEKVKVTDLKEKRKGF